MKRGSQFRAPPSSMALKVTKTSTSNCRKGNKQASGYVLNITETCGKENEVQFITDYALAANVTSDQELLEDRLPEIKERTGAEDVYADGGYYGEDVLQKADESGVNLHYTNMTGKGSNKIPITSFEIENFETIRRCPRNSVPFRTNYNQDTGILTAHFPLTGCKACPFNKECWVKIGKQDALMKVERKSILAALPLFPQPEPRGWSALFEERGQNGAVIDLETAKKLLTKLIQRLTLPVITNR